MNRQINDGSKRDDQIRQLGVWQFVRRLQDGGLVELVQRPDGQMGVGLTARGTEALTVLDEAVNDDDPTYDD